MRPTRSSCAGKKTQNTIVLTPLPETAWNTMFGKYSADVNKMDNFRSYELVLNGKTYDIAREVADNYNSRYFSVVTESGVTSASFIYTQDTGLKFYEPLVVDGVSIEEMTWSGGMFTDEVSGARIQETVSNNKFTFAVSDIKATSVKVKTTPTVANEYYYFNVVPKSAFASMADEDILNVLMNSITSMNDLSRGTAEKTLIVESDTEYVPCGFGLKVVNGYVYPITELAKGTSFMSGQGEPLSPEYQAWLGTWTVTSTSAEVTNAPVTFDVTFSKKVANSTYSVAGWGSSVYRLQYPVTADFNAADGSFTMKNNQELVAGALYFVAECIVEDGTTSLLTSETFVPLQGVMGADKSSASVLCNSGTFTNGKKFAVGTMDLFIYDGGWYGIKPAEGFTSGDYVIGPFKLVKKSAAGSAVKAQASFSNAPVAFKPHKISTTEIQLSSVISRQTTAHAATL